MVKSRIAIAAAAAGMLALPVEAQKTASVQSISARDKQEGAKAHPQLLEEFGGNYTGSQATYVTRIGKRIAVQSGLSNSENDFTVTLLNSPVNNAFAIPGGYVYVTRQLMGLMNDEAELASVLGHEVGHVAARHGQKRQNAATRNSILGALGQVLVGAVAGDSQLGQLLQRGVGTGTQLLTLSYSRSQEYEADDLGVTYLARAGYDPAAASTMLASLAAQTALDARVSGTGSRSVPAWASTHPDPASRVTRALKKAQSTRASGGVRNRDPFLNALNGVLYDDDPKQGVIESTTFRHPDLRLTFTVPQGYGMANGTRAVSISGTGGQAQFAGGALGAQGLDGYIGTVFQGVTGQKVNFGTAQRTRINGLDAAYATVNANTQSGQVSVTVFAYQFDASTAYHFVTITPVNRVGNFDSMFRSMRRLTDAEAAAIRPRKVQVVTVQRGDSLATLSSKMAYADYKMERFLTLNALNANSTLQQGQRVKIITY